MRIPPHVTRNIYAGMVKFEPMSPDRVVVTKPAGEEALMRARKSGGKASKLKAKGRAWRKEKPVEDDDGEE